MLRDRHCPVDATRSLTRQDAGLQESNPMDDLFISATPSSPEVDFRFSEHTLSLKGESYPENAAAFYSDIIQALRQYLAGLDRHGTVTVHVALAYFNSSSTKMLFNLFETLNQAAAEGRRVVLNWYHDVEDDIILEFGQALQTDFPKLQFYDHPVES